MIVRRCLFDSAGAEPVAGDVDHIVCPRHNGDIPTRTNPCGGEAGTIRASIRRRGLYPGGEVVLGSRLSSPIFINETCIPRSVIPRNVRHVSLLSRNHQRTTIRGGTMCLKMSEGGLQEGKCLDEPLIVPVERLHESRRQRKLDRQFTLVIGPKGVSVSKLTLVGVS